MGIVKLLSVEVLSMYITANKEWLPISPYPVNPVASNSYLEKYVMNHRYSRIDFYTLVLFLLLNYVCVLVVRLSLYSSKYYQVGHR